MPHSWSLFLVKLIQKSNNVVICVVTEYMYSKLGVALQRLNIHVTATTTSSSDASDDSYFITYISNGLHDMGRDKYGFILLP